MAYVVASGDDAYYLTVDRHWLVQTRPWGGYTPEEGDTVEVTGHVAQQADIHGEPFLSIEVKTLVPVGV